MALYSYLVDHDLGLAPNPFGGFCTLAVCKPEIRRSRKLAIGDWIAGTGSKALEETCGRRLVGRLIYAMEVTERLTLEEYWSDQRFQYKKPIMNGPLVTMFGDNFYHRAENGDWIQDDSAHSQLDGRCNHDHLRKDTRGANVLISQKFYYFGTSAPQIPDVLTNVIHSTQGQKKLTNSDADSFIEWVSNSFQPGLHGDPLNWSTYNQMQLL